MRNEFLMIIIDYKHIMLLLLMNVQTNPVATKC